MKPWDEAGGLDRGRRFYSPGLIGVPETVIEARPRVIQVYLPQGVTVSPVLMVVPVAPRGAPASAPPMPPVSNETPR